MIGCTCCSCWHENWSFLSFKHWHGKNIFSSFLNVVPFSNFTFLLFSIWHYFHFRFKMLNLLIFSSIFNHEKSQNEKCLFKYIHTISKFFLQFFREGMYEVGWCSSGRTDGQLIPLFIWRQFFQGSSLVRAASECT